MKTKRHPVFWLAVAVLFSCLRSPAAAEDASWVDQFVLPTKRSKHIPFEDKVKDKLVQYRYSGQWPIKVRGEHGGRLRIHDGYPLFFNNRGVAWKNNEDYDKALADFDEAIRLDPKYAAAYYGRAGCLASKSQRDAALESLKHALELGYRNFEHIEKDPALDSIRNDPAYQKLVKQYSK